MIAWREMANNLPYVASWIVSPCSVKLPYLYSPSSLTSSRALNEDNPTRRAILKSERLPVCAQICHVSGASSNPLSIDLLAESIRISGKSDVVNARPTKSILPKRSVLTPCNSSERRAYSSNVNEPRPVFATSVR